MAKPHDSLFKTTFSVPENATPAFQMFLPEPIRALLDIEHPEVEPGSFIDDELVERSTDILYKVPFFKPPDESTPTSAYIYLLFEHQSTVDPWMSFRLLRYMVRIWEYHLKSTPKAESLPLIFPLVLYNGATPWTAALDFQGLMEAPDEILARFKAFVPQFRYVTEILSQRDATTLLGGAMVRLALKFMKHIHDMNLLERIKSWSNELQEVYQSDLPGLNNFCQILQYIMENREFSVEDVGQVFSTIGKKAQEAAMTLAERLREEGREKGKEEGRKEGKEEGRKEGRLLTLLKLIELKFGPPTEATMEKIQSATSAQLDSWTANILSANSIDELLQKQS